MKIKQFNHLWNGQDTKNSSQSFPRQPRIIGQSVCQSNSRTIPPPPSNGWSQKSASRFANPTPYL